MKKLLYTPIFLTLITICMILISSCTFNYKTYKTIDNLQQYLPDMQSKTIACDIDDTTTTETVYQYTHTNDDRRDWRQTNRLNGKTTQEIFGYDYYDTYKREIRQNTISDNSPIKGDYTVLIDEIGKEFPSYDGTRTILSANETKTTPYGTFNNCIYVKIENEGLEAYRYYAPKIGYIYGIAKMGEDFYYEDYISSYLPNDTDTSNSITYSDEIEDYEDNLYRWYLKKTTFENADTNHTLSVEVAGDTLRFIMDGQFLAGTANLDETDSFPNYFGYTAHESNGDFIVRYYPEKESIRIIDNINDNVDYSGIYEYIK